jgi:hypothetical protein
MVDEYQDDQMKLASISLMASGLMLVATSVMAADTMTTDPSSGIGRSQGLESQGLPPAMPEQSTGRPRGSLPEQSPPVPERITQTVPSSPGISSEAPASPDPPCLLQPARLAASLAFFEAR